MAPPSDGQIPATVTALRRPPVLVRSDQRHTFDTFVDTIGIWWPVTPFSAGKDQVRDVTFERRQGGRVFETWQDGTEADWGEVLVWEPPARFVITWNLAAAGLRPGGRLPRRLVLRRLGSHPQPLRRHARRTGMKAVALYEMAPDMMAGVSDHLSAHVERWQGFAQRGELLMIGPFANAQEDGAMAIFATREAAEEFVRGDPFVLNGIVQNWYIRDWQEALVPEPTAD